MDNSNIPYMKIFNFRGRYIQAGIILSCFPVISREENSSLILKDPSEIPSKILTNYNNTITRQGLSVNAPAGK